MFMQLETDCNLRLQAHNHQGHLHIYKINHYFHSELQMTDYK